MRVDFNERQHLPVVKWSTMLRLLKDESGLPLYDDRFEQWVFDEWGIVFLHGNPVYPGHLTGVELDDATYTLLLLKYENHCI